MKIYFDTDPETGAVRFHHEVVLGPRLIPHWKSDKEREAGKRPTMVINPECRVPPAAREISEARFRELMAAQQGGAAIALRKGEPAAIPRTLTEDEASAARRRRRDRLLAASDWTQLPDAPLSEDEKTGWRDYRQALRDLDMAGDTWPLAPDAEGDE